MNCSTRTKILVVEDDPKLAQLMTAVLEGHGYGVLFATDEASTLLLARAERPELICLDLPLPTNERLYEALRKDPELGTVPVIVVNDENRRSTGFSRRAAVRYLSSPLVQQSLVAAVKHVLHSREQLN